MVAAGISPGVSLSLTGGQRLDCRFPAAGLRLAFGFPAVSLLGHASVALGLVCGSATGVRAKLPTGISPGVSLSLSVGRRLDCGAPATGQRWHADGFCAGHTARARYSFIGRGSFPMHIGHLLLVVNTKVTSFRISHHVSPSLPVCSPTHSFYRI